MNAPLVAKVGGGATVLVSAVAGVSYEMSKETIWHKVKDDCLSLKASDLVWAAAEKKLKDYNETSSTTLVKEFKDLKTKLSASTVSSDQGAILVLTAAGTSSSTGNTQSSDTGGSQSQTPQAGNSQTQSGSQEQTQPTTITPAPSTSKSGSELKKVCREIYERVIKDMFSAEEPSSTLISQVKQFCSYTIKEKLSSISNTTVFDGTETDANKTDIETKISELNDDSKEPFKKFKVSTGGTKDWKGYKSECQKLYKKQWNGKNESVEGDYKLAHTYCKKTTTPTTTGAAGAAA